MKLFDLDVVSLAYSLINDLVTDNNIGPTNNKSY